MWSLRIGAVFAAAVGLSCGAVVMAAAATRYVEYSGVARARHEGTVLYGEHHVLEYDDARLVRRVVLYTCKDGAAFARKTVRYVDRFAPDFMLDDVANGMQEGIRSDGGTRSVFFRAAHADPERSSPLPSAQGLVADAGFDEFVRAQWPALDGGKPVALRFLVPSRLTDYGFQVQRLRSDHIGGVPVEVFRLRLSGLWGWILPGIDVAYTTRDHVLVRYDGLSDLRDGSNNNFQAEITFPLAERHDTDARAFAAASAVTLSACHAAG